MNTTEKLKLAAEAGVTLPHFTNTVNPVDFPFDTYTDEEIEEYFPMNTQEKLSYLINAKGNLLDLAEAHRFDVVVQGCNCFNTMGGGIAREIKSRYPHVAAVDAATVRGDYNKLGNWTSESVETGIQQGNQFDIINAYTQYDMSTGEDVFEYAAFALILQKLLHCYPDGTRYGFPYIGMGLAKGDAAVIICLLEEFAEKVSAKGGSVTLVEFA